MKLARLVLAVGITVFAFMPMASAEFLKGETFVLGQDEFKDSTGLRRGKATLKTGFAGQGQYDSNVYLTPSKKTKDYVFTLSPKLLLDVPFGIRERHLFQAMYLGTGGLYCDQTSQNYMNQRGAVNLNLTLPFGYFNVNDNFVDTTDRSATEFTTQVHRLSNTAATKVGITHNKLSYEVGYENFFNWYYKDQYKNLGYYENDFTGTVYYQLFPKTKALIEYKLGLLDYYRDKSRNGYFNQVVTGLRGDLTGKTVGFAKFGFQARDYDSGDGYHSYVGEIGTITKFSERTEVTVRYYTAPLESVASNGNYYTSNNVSLMLDKKLINHFSARLKSEIGRALYPQSDPALGVKRRDWLFTEGVWFFYNIKSWGKVGIGYDFKCRSSNIGSEGYAENLVSTRFDLAY